MLRHVMPQKPAIHNTHRHTLPRTIRAALPKSGFPIPLRPSGERERERERDRERGRLFVMATPGPASELTSPQAIKGDVTAARDEQEKSKTPVPATVCPRSVRSYLQTRVPVALESLTEGSKESPLPDRAPAWAPSAAPAPHVPQTRSMASLRYMSSSTTSPAYPLPAWHAGSHQVGLVMQHVSEECRCQSSRPGDPGLGFRV